MFNFNNPTVNGSLFSGQDTGAALGPLQGTGGITPSGAIPTGTSIFGAGSSPVGGGNFFQNADGGINTDNLGLAIGGIQTLGSLWSSFQQQKLAKDQVNLQRQAFQTNLANNTKTYNTALEDRIRSRYNTEGRSSSEADAYISENSL